MEQDNVEVCVVGGGPGGSVAALRLAQLGHRVVLVERAPFPRSHVGESLTKGVQTLFDVLRLRQSFLEDDFLNVEETLIRWESDKTEKLDKNASGPIVNRGKFDMLLLKAAETAGTTIIQPARAGKTDWDGSAWRLEVRLQSEIRSIRARYLIDATGRRSFVACARKSSSSPTLALCGYLRITDRPSPIRIEAMPDGWCWGAPVPGKLFSTMIFIDPEMLRRQRTRGLEEFWRSQLAKTHLFTDLSHLPLIQPVSGHDATTSYASDPFGQNFIRVGEASFTLDPLSSTGVEKAMQTGCLAATMVHTMILSPERTDLCRQFYRERHAEMVSTHAEWSTEFYKKVERYSKFPFWQARRQSSSETQFAPTTSTSNIPSRPLKPTTWVKLSDESRLVSKPCIVGDELCERMALWHPSLDRPVAFVGGVDLEQLLVGVRQKVDIETLLTIWSTRVSLKQAMRIMDWLIKNGILEPTS